MSLSVKVMLDKDLSVRFSQLVGSKLVTSIFNQWALIGKERINSSVFSLKSVINLFSSKIGGIQVTFLPVKKLFKTD